MKERRPPTLLIVEDSDEDFLTLTRIFKKLSMTYSVTRCVKGEETLDFLYRRGKYKHLTEIARPSLILLDLNLIGLDGRKVLERVKLDQDLRKIPIVIMTTSSNPKDVHFCYDHGANSYLVKPVHLDHLTQTILWLIGYWFDAVVLPEDAE